MMGCGHKRCPLSAQKRMLEAHPCLSAKCQYRKLRQVIDKAHRLPHQLCKSDHCAIPVQGLAQIGDVQGSRRCAALDAHRGGHADRLTVGETLRGDAR